MSEFSVSVVIPCLNAIEHLPAAVASVRRVLSQTTTEIVIADGGSTDGTLEYLDTLNVATLHGPDRSLYDGLNKALDRAQGTHIIWLNADDELLPGMAELLIHAQDSGSDLVTGEAEIVQGQETVWQSTHAERQMDAASIFFAVPTINSRIFHASLLARTGPFNWEVGLAADRLMMHELMKQATKRSWFPKPVYRYQSHEGSRTIGNSWLSNESVHHANMAIAQYLTEQETAFHDQTALAEFDAVSRFAAARASVMLAKPGTALKTALGLLSQPSLVAASRSGLLAHRRFRGQSSGW